MTAPKLLLHACCGPCVLHPERTLALDWDITAYFCNPNIHPRWEWNRRRKVVLDHCEPAGIQVLTDEYMPNEWSKRVLTGSDDPVPERCRRCYALRLERTAEHAAGNGFAAFSTTLLVSPHQDHDAVVDAGVEAAETYGIRFLADDFRDGYSWGVGRSKQLRMYRQNYCGCILSLVERGQARRLAALNEKSSRQPLKRIGG